ncbi:MAG: hypothetical protein ACKOAY_10650 [Haliscomenobacter sp.]
MRVLTLASVLLLPILASAHPGHGHSNGYDSLHFLTAPEHLAPIVLAGTAVLLGLFMRYSRKKTTR